MPILYQTIDATTTTWNAAATPMAGGGIMHTVIVGGDAGLVYTPSEIVAAVGDVVHFVFMKNNHTVTQSTFDKPCNKKSADAPDSGFLANANNTVVPAPTFEYTVVSMDPTWWYCKQKTGTHCGKGMVFAINPTAEKTLKVFYNLAIQLNGTVATTIPAATTALTASTTSIGSIVVGTPMANSGGSCQCQCFCPAGSFDMKAVNYGAASDPPTLPSPPSVSTLVTSTRTSGSTFSEAAISTPVTTYSPSETEAYAEVTPADTSAIVFVGTLTEVATTAMSTSIASVETILSVAPSTMAESTTIPSSKTLMSDTIPSTAVESTTIAATETLALDTNSSTMFESTTSASVVLDTTSSTMAESAAETLALETTSSTMAESAAETTSSTMTKASMLAMVESDYTTTKPTPTTQTASTPVFLSSLILSAPTATAGAGMEVDSTPAEAPEPINDVAAESTEAPRFVDFSTVDLSGLHSAWTGGIQPTPL